jgi:hypothetical protein
MKQIKMITVESSQLDTVGYDEDTNDMYVEFGSGMVYKYSVVPKRVFDRLINPALSSGSFFYSDVRMIYKYIKTDLKVKNSTIDIQ